MGRAIIESEQGKGLYEIKVFYNMDRALAKKKNLENNKKVLDKYIKKLTIALDNLDIEKNILVNNINQAISISIGNVGGGVEILNEDLKLISAAIAKLTLKQAEINEQLVPYKASLLRLANIDLELKRISAAEEKYVTPNMVYAWCIDYTEGLKKSLLVGTIELFDDTNKPLDEPILIQSKGSAKDPKIIQPAISSGGMAIAYNITALPALQKYKPLYRSGIISNIDYLNDTCDISFSKEPQFSAIRGFIKADKYKIISNNLVGSPIRYMDCDAEAFVNNDKVVVEFALGSDNKTLVGTVVGFVSNPFKCPVNIYLETGFLDLGFAGRCGEQSFLPSKLFLDSITQTYSNSILNPMLLNTRSIPSDLTQDSPFFGNKPINGQDSIAVGCLNRDKVEKIIDYCMNEYNAGGYCSGLNFKKEAQLKIPSSMFSGKLQLFVQSIYGSNLQSYRISGKFDLEISYPQEDLAIYKPVILSRKLEGGAILYTTDNYRYFLITYSLGIITAYPMDLTPAGEEFRNLLLVSNRLNDVQYVTRVEAYILSTAKINSKNKVQTNLLGEQIPGFVVDYGWHATWKGDRSVCVTYVTDPTPPVTPRYLSTKNEMVIRESIDITSGRISLSFTNSTPIVDQEWWPRTSLFHVLTFSEQAESMFPIPYPAVVFDGFEGNFDSIVYVYIERDYLTGVETEIDVNVYMDIKIGTNTNFELTNFTEFTAIAPFETNNTTNVLPLLAGESGIKVNGAILANQKLEHINNRSTASWRNTVSSPVERGFLIDLNGELNSAQNNNSGIQYGLNSGLTLNQTKELPFFNPTNGTTENVTANWAWRAKWVRWDRDSDLESGISNAGTSFLEIPLGDCNRIIAGSSELRSSDGGFSSIGTSGNIYTSFGGQLVWYFNVPFFGKPTLEVISGAPGDEVMIYNAFLSSNTSNTTPINPVSNIYDTRFLIQENNTQILKVQKQNNGNKKYFSPTTSDPKTNTVDTARRSISNLNSVDHTEFSHDGGFINDSAIGFS